MQYVHVKNLEKYHPGYKDRGLLWCKVYFTMVSGDHEFEMLDEIDKWRFVSFMVLELQSKKPTPVDNKFLIRKGFDPEKRSIELTLQMLRNFIELVTEDCKVCNVDKRREDKRIKESAPPEQPSAATYSQPFIDKAKKADTLGFNVYQQVNIQNKGKLNKLPESVMIEILDEFFDQKDSIKDIFPYMKRVILEKSRKYWSGENVKEHESIKKGPVAVGSVLRQLADSAA